MPSFKNKYVRSDKPGRINKHELLQSLAAALLRTALVPAAGTLVLILVAPLAALILTAGLTYILCVHIATAAALLTALALITHVTALTTLIAILVLLVFVFICHN
jgi:hypothetical protein